MNREADAGDRRAAASNTASPAQSALLTVLQGLQGLQGLPGGPPRPPPRPSSHQIQQPPKDPADPADPGAGFAYNVFLAGSWPRSPCGRRPASQRMPRGRRGRWPGPGGAAARSRGHCAGWGCEDVDCCAVVERRPQEGPGTAASWMAGPARFARRAATAPSLPPLPRRALTRQVPALPTRAPWPGRCQPGGWAGSGLGRADAGCRGQRQSGATPESSPEPARWGLDRAGWRSRASWSAPWLRGRGRHVFFPSK